MQLTDIGLLGLLRLGYDIIRSALRLSGWFNARHSEICAPETGDILSFQEGSEGLPEHPSHTRSKAQQAQIHRRPDGGIDVIPLDS